MQPFTGALVMVLMSITILNPPSHGTTIVAIRTPELFVIAADSAGTFKGGGTPVAERPVSKIFQSGNVLFAISGMTKDLSRGFNSESIIATTLKTSQTLQAAATNLEIVLSEALREELSQLKNDEASVFQDMASSDSVTVIVLASFENAQILTVGIQFLREMDAEGKIAVRPFRYSCPGDCPGNTYTFFLGSRKAIDKYKGEHGRKLPISPEDAARFMVQLEIDAKTPGVAPPIDVAKLDKDGITWLTREIKNSSEVSPPHPGLR